MSALHASPVIPMSFSKKSERRALPELNLTHGPP
jgi:hypothetical protein